MNNHSTYAGDISCQEAWDILKGGQLAFIVDVRTQAEWAFVGLPVLQEVGSEPLLVEWQSYPTMDRNLGFAEILSDTLTAKGADTDAHLLFLCRSGVRSQAAAMAMTASGYRNCYNVAGGFEGPPDNKGHRGRTGGWKAAGLPWAQS